MCKCRYAEFVCACNHDACPHHDPGHARYHSPHHVWRFDHFGWEYCRSAVGGTTVGLPGGGGSGEDGEGVGHFPHSSLSSSPSSSGGGGCRTTTAAAAANVKDRTVSATTAGSGRNSNSNRKTNMNRDRNRNFLRGEHGRVAKAVLRYTLHKFCADAGFRKDERARKEKAEQERRQQQGKEKEKEEEEEAQHRSGSGCRATDTQPHDHHKATPINMNNNNNDNKKKRHKKTPAPPPRPPRPAEDPELSSLLSGGKPKGIRSRRSCSSPLVVLGEASDDPRHGGTMPICDGEGGGGGGGIVYEGLRMRWVCGYCREYWVGRAGLI